MFHRIIMGNRVAGQTEEGLPFLIIFNYYLKRNENAMPIV